MKVGLQLNQRKGKLNLNAGMVINVGMASNVDIVIDLNIVKKYI